MVRNRVVEGEIKKGPWTCEEDEILMNFVRENGPRDWSSIRSKGLLPRTGKSCRLRWVNKLQPNLKRGCKFSAEEERLVLELQAAIGNKWAAIATYLPGRTDNDVKNFWNIRQKRLARILRSSSQPNRRSIKKRGTTAVVDLEASSSSSFQDSRFSTNQFKSASLNYDICSCLCSENNSNGVNNLALASPYCVTPYVADVNMSQPSMVDFHTNPNDNLQNAILNENDHLPLLQENLDFGMEFGEKNFMALEGFAHQEAFEVGNMSQQLNLGVLMEQLDHYRDNNNNSGIPMPDNVFGDFSEDMLDNHLQTVPRSSSSS